MKPSGSSKPRRRRPGRSTRPARPSRWCGQTPCRPRTRRPRRVAPPPSKDYAARGAFAVRVQSGEIVKTAEGAYRKATPQEFEAAQAAAAACRRRENEAESRAAEVARLGRAQWFWEQSGTPERYVHADLREIGGTPAAYRATAGELMKLLVEPGIVVLVGGAAPARRTWPAGWSGSSAGGVGGQSTRRRSKYSA